MKLRSTVILILLLISLYSKSQSLEFKEGYIINLKGDTLKGQVSIESTSTNSQYCNFKLNDQERVSVYLPKDLIGYGIFNGPAHVKKIILVNESSKELFLQLVVDGVIDLYYVATDSREFFLVEKGAKIYELDNSPYIITKDNKNYLRKSDKYKGMLKYLLNESSFTSSYFERIDYVFEDLIKVIIEYHECTSPAYVCKVYDYSNKKSSDKKVKIGYRISFGINFSNMELSNSILLSNNIATITETNANFSRGDINFSPSFGLIFQKNLKYTFHIDANYQKISIPELTTERIRIPITIQREFLGKKRLVPTVAIGVIPEYCFNSTPNDLRLKSRLVIGYNNGVPVYEEITGIIPSSGFNNKFNFRPFASIGIILKKNQVSKVHIELKAENKSSLNYKNSINSILPINSALRISNTVLALNYIL